MVIQPPGTLPDRLPRGVLKEQHIVVSAADSPRQVLRAVIRGGAVKAVDDQEILLPRLEHRSKRTIAGREDRTSFGVLELVLLEELLGIELGGSERPCRQQNSDAQEIGSKL